MITIEYIGKIQYILVNVTTVIQAHTLENKSLIFDIVRQRAAPRLGIFALVIFIILLTRTYSHRPTILRFQEVNKILW